MAQHKKKYSRQKSMKKQNAARSGRDPIPLPRVYTRISRLWRHKSHAYAHRSMRRRCKHIFRVCLRQCAKGLLQIKSLSATNRIVIFTSQKNNRYFCTTVQTHRRPFSKYILPRFSRDLWYTRWLHAHTFWNDGHLVDAATETAADSTST